MKNYSLVAYEEALNKNEAYSNFIQKLTFAIDEIAPCKTKMVKGNSKELLDSVISEGINNGDKLYKNFKKSRLLLDQENFKKAHYEVKRLIPEEKEKLL